MIENHHNHNNICNTPSPRLHTHTHIVTHTCICRRELFLLQPFIPVVHGYNFQRGQSKNKRKKAQEEKEAKNSHTPHTPFQEIYNPFFPCFVNLSVYLHVTRVQILCPDTIFLLILILWFQSVHPGLGQCHPGRQSRPGPAEVWGCLCLNPGPLLVEEETWTSVRLILFSFFFSFPSFSSTDSTALANLGLRRGEKVESLKFWWVGGAVFFSGGGGGGVMVIVMMKTPEESDSTFV